MNRPEALAFATQLQQAAYLLEDVELAASLRDAANHLLWLDESQQGLNREAAILAADRDRWRRAYMALLPTYVPHQRQPLTLKVPECSYTVGPAAATPPTNG